MRPFAPIRGIYFDLWNTLAFTAAPANPVLLLAAAFGLHATPDWRDTIERAMMTRRLSGIGEALDAIALATGRTVGPGVTRRELVLAWGEANNGNRLYPDALPTLRALRRPVLGREPIRIGVLSNTQSFDLDFMRREGLEALLDEICLSCDCGALKPDRELFRLAAERLGLPPGQILMVGDRRREDVDGAISAGMQAILLDRSGGSQGALRSLSDLPRSLMTSS